MASKLCTKCQVEKDAADFPKDSRLRSGLSSQCRACHAARFARHYEQNKDKIIAKSTAWTKANPERVKELRRRHYRKTRPKKEKL